MSEQLRFLTTVVLKVFRAHMKAYLPDFKLALEHFCIHTVGSGVGSPTSSSTTSSSTPGTMSLQSDALQVSATPPAARSGTSSPTASPSDGSRRDTASSRLPLALGSNGTSSCGESCVPSTMPIDENPWIQDVDVLPIDVPKVGCPLTRPPTKSQSS